MAHAPLAVVLRGGMVESLHYGALAAADASGRLIAQAGDPLQLTFPRSALKPFQALLLAESGAMAAFGLDSRHLALACASHRAEPEQMQLLEAWLQRLELDEEALACGPDWPESQSARDALVRAGGGPRRLQHNCSGKHLGLLSWCRLHGAPIKGYHHPDHPAQRGVRAMFADTLGGDIPSEAFGLDGCNLPTPRLRLADFAKGLARFAAASNAAPSRQAAMHTLLGAMREHPGLVSGARQATQAVCNATKGRVLPKLGAEGVLAAWLPQEGIGVAIKTADGGARARFPILIEALAQLELLDASEAEALEAWRRPLLHNSAGTEVGAIEPSFTLA